MEISSAAPRAENPTIASLSPDLANAANPTGIANTNAAITQRWLLQLAPGRWASDSRKMCFFKRSNGFFESSGQHLYHRGCNRKRRRQKNVITPGSIHTSLY